MKLLLLLENSEINSYLTKTIFKKLPLAYKKGLMTYMYEGEPVEWSVTSQIRDWVNDPNVLILIRDYAAKHGNKAVEYGMVPTSLIIQRLGEWLKEEGYANFTEYHKAYQSTNPAVHGDSLFPLLVDDSNPEYIEDGWHRFHYYVSKGLEEIPVVKLN